MKNLTYHQYKQSQLESSPTKEIMEGLTGEQHPQVVRLDHTSPLLKPYLKNFHCFLNNLFSFYTWLMSTAALLKEVCILILRCAASLWVTFSLTHWLTQRLTHWLTNITLRMSRHRDQKTMNQSLQSFTLLAFNVIPKKIE